MYTSVSMISVCLNSDSHRLKYVTSDITLTLNVIHGLHNATLSI